MDRFPRMKTSALLACIFLAAPAMTSAETLTLGSVSDNVKKHLARFEPLAAYLSNELGDDGITKVDVKVMSSSDEMITAI